MIQRIQSLYLGAVCITMITFLRVVLWMKIDLNHVCTMRPYAMIASTGHYIIFPYGLSALLACFLIVTAIYTIIRHDNRKLQLRLMVGINLMLVVLMVLIWVLIKKANATYLLRGYSSPKIGSVLPCIALLANLLAAYHIKKDEALVNEDRLR